MFAIYTGLRYTDIMSLKSENLIEDESGYSWISIVQIKTRELVKIPILHEAGKILNKYMTLKTEKESILPVISNQKTNKYLKEIAALAGIQKKVTFHMARHTFATTIAPMNNLPIEMVSKWLGHNKLSTTMIYTQITDQRLKNYAEGLNEKLKINRRGEGSPAENLENLRAYLHLQRQALIGIVNDVEKSIEKYLNGFSIG